MLQCKYLKKYCFNILTTIGLMYLSYYISDRIYLKQTTSLTETFTNGMVLHLFTVISFCTSHYLFHVVLPQMHKAHHYITHKDEHNVVWVFSYSDPVENTIITCSLLVVPHILMFISGYINVSEELFHCQMLFVLTTHSFLFKHNHRKHHFYHDEVFGDLITMCIGRCIDHLRLSWN